MQNRKEYVKGNYPFCPDSNGYRFRLKKCSSRNKLTCPSCGKPFRFVPYIDTEGELAFPDFVGRCDREDSCGYHYTPKMFFTEHPEIKGMLHEGDKTVTARLKKPEEKAKPPPSYIETNLMLQTMRAYDHNNLVKFLHTIMDDNSVKDVIKRYNIGTAKLRGNSTVFWQVDMHGKVHAGKIIKYNATDGHRTKSQERNDVAWVHSTMRIPGFVLEQCYFGEHLLTDETKTVALVESEKTAIIASEFFPQFIWLASGGKSGCFNSRMHILKGRNVVLYPDLKATAEWQIKAEHMRLIGINTEVSTYLEDIATEEERDDGLDIADYIVKGIRQQQYEASATKRETEAILKRMTAKFPCLQMLIDKLQLELIY